MIIETTWTEVKRVAQQKNLPAQSVEDVNSRVHVYVVDGQVTVRTLLVVGSSEHDEFVALFSSAASRRVATSTSALCNPEDYRFRGTATAWTECPPGTTDIDITPSVTEDRFVSGGFIIHKDANSGDTVSFKVVHPSLGVMETYVPSWLVAPGTGSSLVEVYPARIPAGLILRVSYNNVGGTSAYCGINYLLHRRGTGA